MNNCYEKRRVDRFAPGLLAFLSGLIRLYLHPVINQDDIFAFQLECHFP